jgi:hypothetical protein
MIAVTIKPTTKTDIVVRLKMKRLEIRNTLYRRNNKTIDQRMVKKNTVHQPQYYLKLRESQNIHREIIPFACRFTSTYIAGVYLHVFFSRSVASNSLYYKTMKKG